MRESKGSVQASGLEVGYEGSSGWEKEIQRTTQELLNQLDRFDKRTKTKVLVFPWMSSYVVCSALLHPTADMLLFTRWWWQHTELEHWTPPSTRPGRLAFHSWCILGLIDAVEIFLQDNLSSQCLMNKTKQNISNFHTIGTNNFLHPDFPLQMFTF